MTMYPPTIASPTYRSVHSPASHVSRAAMKMPATVDKIWNIRESLHQDYMKRLKPYRGELGLESYSPWQIPHYFLIRPIVEDFVDNFIVNNIPGNFSLRLGGFSEHQKLMEDLVLSESRALRLVGEELVLQVTLAMMREIVAEGITTERMFRQISANLFIKEAEIQATGVASGRQPNEKLYDLITSSFDSLQKARDHHRKSIWSHTLTISQPEQSALQVFQRDPTPSSTKGKKGKIEPLKGKTPSIIVKQDEPLDADTIRITNNHLHPEDLKVREPSKIDGRKEKNQKLWAQIYQQKELAYWCHFKPFVFSVSIPKHLGGVSTVCPSPDHMMLAVGGVSGDVVVFNTQVEPWAPIRFALGNGTVVSLAWSADSSRLMCVRNQDQAQGSLTVWQTNGEPAGKDTLGTLGLTKEQPYALTAVHHWDSRAGHFALDEETMADRETEEIGEDVPTVGGFYPSLSVLTTQNHVCAALNHGHILKFDLTSLKYGNESIKPITVHKVQYKNQNSRLNKTKQGLEVQQLRQHQYPVIHIGFSGNIGKMVTVDREGFINVWKLDRDHLTSFEWYFPEKKYKLTLNKQMFIPSSTDKARVVFTDRRRSKTTTQKQIASERKQMQDSLDRMQLGEPWHVARDITGLETTIYIPPGVAKESGAMLNIVVRHEKTQQLSTFMTRMYQPVKIRCFKIVAVKQNPSGEDLVFVLLFPEFSPKPAHLMIIILHLSTMKLRNFRKDIILTKEEFKEIQESQASSADISKVYGPTGADYLFLTVGSKVLCLSLNTGNTVLRLNFKSKDPSFQGLTLEQKDMHLSKTHQIACLGNLGSLYAITYDKNISSLRVLRLEDNNSHEATREMWKSYQNSPSFHHTPSELRINPTQWALSDMKHKEVEMASMLQSLLHSEIGVVENTEEARERRNRDKVNCYKAIEFINKELLKD